MKTLFFIGIGSFAGGVLRYLISIFVQHLALNKFPFGTLTVNLVGCLLIGIVFGFAEKGNISPDMKLFLATGFLGGFTTFSAFSNDTLTLLQGGQYGYAISYVMTSVVIGLALTFVGMYLVKGV